MAYGFIELDKAVVHVMRLVSFVTVVSTSALLTMPKPLCGSQETVENSSRDGSTRPPDLSPEKCICRSRSKRTGHGTTGWFQIGKGVH